MKLKERKTSKFYVCEKVKLSETYFKHIAALPTHRDMELLEKLLRLFLHNVSVESWMDDVSRWWHNDGEEETKETNKNRNYFLKDFFNVLLIFEGDWKRSLREMHVVFVCEKGDVFVKMKKRMWFLFDIHVSRTWEEVIIIHCDVTIFIFIRWGILCCRWWW